MSSVLETCQPRQELIDGTFNPEIFTAALGPIIKHYRSEPSAIDQIYTNAEAFFTQATYPTQGLVNTLTNVFRRIGGDATAPAIQRLETSFGGGKTHTLIACTHLAYRGRSIASSVQSIIDERLLPEEGSVSVVGIAGDEIAVTRVQGENLIPHTLWGEIAWQIGGEALYRSVRTEAESHAAPGKQYLERVLGGRKVLLMLDELAQYAARLEVAQQHGAEQLSAFLMSLNGFARDRTGLAILVTLAGSTDAFSRQTNQLTNLLNQLTSDSLSEDDASAIGERAVRGISSVISRDATVETPVQATEIASVLSKRLFAYIDPSAAAAIAEEYMSLYRYNSSLLPEDAIQENYRSRMIANYPFHPSLVDFLNQKLSIAENFQGTRGVLRVLAMTVRQIWRRQKHLTMIHASHMDLRDGTIVNELLGRTGSAELLNVLNADVGGVNTSMQIEGGLSNAERADRKNPHPDQIPIFEYTWKTVFLHSLVGRSQGVSSRIFGLTEQDAILAVATPLTPPTQIRTALHEINDSAFFLRYSDGKYYAHLDPTLNSVLATIRRGVTIDQINATLKTSAKRLITDNPVFHIEHDVSLPEHMPDNKEKPMLGVVSINAGTIDIEAILTTSGQNRPRIRQNLVFLLVPKTVSVLQSQQQSSIDQLINQTSNADQEYLQDIARQVVAMRLLEQGPQNFGITQQKLQTTDFRARFSEREQALMTAVSQTYTALYYSSVSGDIIRKEIKVVTVEGGTSIIRMIEETLIKDKELLTSANTTTTDLEQLRQLFLENSDFISIKEIESNFLNVRRWPVLDSQTTLQQLLRAGVEKGIWVLYKFGHPDDNRPSELFKRENSVPYGVELLHSDYKLISVQGAHSRGWLSEEGPSPTQVYEVIKQTLQNTSAVTLADLRSNVNDQLGIVPESIFDDQVIALAQQNQAMLYAGQPNQMNRPEVLTMGYGAGLVTLHPDNVIITPSVASERGWQNAPSQRFTRQGIDNAQKIHELLPRLSSLYNRGLAKSDITNLELYDLSLGNDAKLRITLENLDATAMKRIDELLTTISQVAQLTDQSGCYLEIQQPQDGCKLIEELT